MLKCLEKGIIIPNIERFNFKFDDQYMVICTGLGAYPYNVDVKPTMKILVKLLFPCLAMCAAPAQAQEEPAMPSAEDWYKADYAALYGDKPWEKLDELLSHFATTIHDHDYKEQYDAREWLSSGVEEWKVDGWIRSDLSALDVDLLNPTTASFKAKWRDYYTGGNISHECSWYLADVIDGKWLITEYATIDCSKHGL